MCTKSRRQSGFTLIELIMFIVIVGVGLAGVLSSLNMSVMHSADPLQPKQAMAIAEATLESILLRDYDKITDPLTPPLPTLPAPLSSYAVEVKIDNTSTVKASGVDFAARQIRVTVRTPSSVSYTLTGYRMNY